MKEREALQKIANMTFPVSDEGKEEPDNIIPISYKGLDGFILVDIMPRFKNGDWWYNNKNHLIGQIKDFKRLNISMIENEYHYKIVGQTVGLELFDVPIFEMPTKADSEPNQTEAEKEVTPIKPKLTFDKEISQWVDIYSYELGIDKGRKQVIEEIEEWVEENNHTMGESESPKFVYMGNLLNYINSLK